MTIHLTWTAVLVALGCAAVAVWVLKCLYCLALWIWFMLRWGK